MSALIVAACGGAASPPPSVVPSPSPTPTPNPHLHEPASVDTVFRALTATGLRITANTAGEGLNGEPLKIITATYAGWPLLLSQYSSHATLVADSRFDPKARNQAGDPPFSVVGLNILVTYGPTNGNVGLAAPDASYVAAAQTLVATLDPLLGPLQQRSVVALQLPGALPSPTATTRPSSSPITSPKPTKKPKATPKPSG